MVGFPLKKKQDPPKKTGFGGFALKKKAPAVGKKTVLKAFGTVEKEDDEEQVIKIDTFDAKVGAYDKETGPVPVKGKPVIPNAGNGDWRKITKERFNPTRPKNEVVQEETKKMEYGLNFVTKKKEQSSDDARLLPSKKELAALQNHSDDGEPTMEDYEAMPVEDFGAAMLRGMGWVEEDEDEKEKKEQDKQDVRPRRRPGYLGLGATAPPDDDKDPEEAEYMPPFKLVKKSNRDKSPSRQIESYRDRN